MTKIQGKTTHRSRLYSVKTMIYEAIVHCERQNGVCERPVNAFMNGRSLVVHCERRPRKCYVNKRKISERSVNGKVKLHNPVHSPPSLRMGGEE
jgi:hypothetical protein